MVARSTASCSTCPPSGGEARGRRRGERGGRRDRRASAAAPPSGWRRPSRSTTGLPIVAVPDDVRRVGGDGRLGASPRRGGKTTGVDPRVLPRAVVYDATLTLGLPIALGGGVRAERGRALRRLAVGAARRPDQPRARRRRACARSLPGLRGARAPTPGPRRARAGALRRLPRRGRVRLRRLRAAPQDLPRARRRFDLPHAPMHAVVLPYVTAFNAPAAPDAAARIAAALGGATPPPGSGRWTGELGAPVVARRARASRGRTCRARPR